MVPTPLFFGMSYHTPERRWHRDKPELSARALDHLHDPAGLHTDGGLGLVDTCRYRQPGKPGGHRRRYSRSVRHVR